MAIFGPIGSFFESKRDGAEGALREVYNEWADQRVRIAALERALRKALKIIDDPTWVDSGGMRPSNHPAVDDMRELLKPSQ